MVLHMLSCSTVLCAARICVHDEEQMPKSNLTIKIDDDLLRDIRVVAAKRDSSISALLAEYAEKVVRNDKDYEEAKERALAILREARPLNWEKPRSRDEIYER